ncbi:MAG: hypothetical protein HYZ17_10290 [Betaproteobacteria bacterium]|nr:hypothetical protein [Betaproteobacteria bacterium]
MKNRTPPFRPKQQGIALALVLMLLVVTTMIGTTAMRTARIQEQLAGATYDRAVARAAGDAAMVDAHLYVMRPDFSIPAVAPAPIFATNDGWTIETWRRRDFDWLGSGAKSLGAGRADGAALTSVLANPTFVVEGLPPETIQTGRVEPVMRATVRATGARATTEHYSMAIILMPH